MTTNHPHIATPYELQAAAERRLKAIAFPLLPEPTLVDTKDCFVQRGQEWRWITPKAHATWKKDEPPCELVLKCLQWKEGDRIYLTEKWCKGDWGNAFNDDIYFTESTTPEAENIGWQPASTMPQEAAQHWFAIASVRVCRCKNLDLPTWICTGIASPPLKPYSKITQRWDVAYPKHPLDGDRWVVVLEVEAVSSCQKN